MKKKNLYRTLSGHNIVSAIRCKMSSSISMNDSDRLRRFCSFYDHFDFDFYRSDSLFILRILFSIFLILFFYVSVHTWLFSTDLFLSVNTFNCPCIPGSLSHRSLHAGLLAFKLQICSVVFWHGWVNGARIVIWCANLYAQGRSKNTIWLYIFHIFCFHLFLAHTGDHQINVTHSGM